MTRERMFYIAYEICNYIRNCEMQNQFEDYEFCMYVSDMANNIEYAIRNGNGSVLKPYYNMLKNELDNVCWNDEYTKEVKELIYLLDECNGCFHVYK